jgi:hypothetical protein
MAQQTALEWFYQRILAEDIKSVFEQAKEMEKEQITEAYNWAAYEQASNRELDLSAAEVYYNKKYKQ